MSTSHQAHLGGRTWYRRIALGILAAVLLAGGLFGPIGPRGVAHASGLNYNDNGKHEIPPLNFYNATGSSSLFVQHNPTIYPIFWGSDWNNDTATMNTIVNTLKALAGSQYNEVLSQYTDNSGPDGFVHNDVRVMSPVVDSSAPLGDMDLGWYINPTSTTPIVGAEGMGEANKIIAQKGWHVNQDSQVMIFPEKGTTYLLGTQWCGIHSWNYHTSSPYALAFVQYGDNNSTCDPVGNTADDIAWTAVHEYAEMATDPQVTADLNIIDLTYTAFGGGWHTTDSSLKEPEEVGDLCEGYSPNSQNAAFPDYTETNSAGNHFNLPYLWSNSDGGCVSGRGGVQEFPSQDTAFPFTGKHTVRGTILSEYLSMPGLGDPLTEEVDQAGGAVSYFDGQYCPNGYHIPSSISSEFGGSGHTASSAIYYSGATFTHEVQGCIFAEYSNMGGPGGVLGFPTSDQHTWGPALVNDFSGATCGPYGHGMIIWTAATGAHEIQGCIADEYLGIGGAPSSGLGYPTNDEHTWGPSRVNDFSGATCGSQGHGMIIWTAATGAHEIQGCIADKYLSLGGAPSSGLGVPTSDEHTLTNAGGSLIGYVSNFQGSASSVTTPCGNVHEGHIFYSPATGAYETDDCIDTAYIHKYGGPSGTLLGFPVSDEVPISNVFYTNSLGYYNSFQKSTCGQYGRGQIYTFFTHDSTVQTHEVQGCIDNAYLLCGGAAGPLGFPISDEHTIIVGALPARVSDFQNGTIIFQNGVTTDYLRSGSCP